MNDSSIVRVMDQLCDVLQRQAESIFGLESGASFHDILSVESLLGLTLPLQLRELLETYNGQRRQLPNGEKCDLLLPSLRVEDGAESYGSGYAYFCGVEQMLLETLRFREGLDRIVQDGTSLSEYNVGFSTVGSVVIGPSMLVISSVWNPTMVCVDLDPERPDQIGQIVAISEQPAVAAVLAPSIEEYFGSILRLHRTSKLVPSNVNGIRAWSQGESPSGKSRNR
jgi:cell wall assembly regulator SMI1